MGSPQVLDFAGSDATEPSFTTVDSPMSRAVSGATYRSITGVATLSVFDATQYSMRSMATALMPNCTASDGSEVIALRRSIFCGSVNPAVAAQSDDTQVTCAMVMGMPAAVAACVH